jgi:hypothetical protein
MTVKLSSEEVATLARAGGLRVLAEDLPEVTVRVNAFLDGLAALDDLPLDTVQPIPALPHPEEPE